MAKTERTELTFTVKEFDPGPARIPLPYIGLETYGPPFPPNDANLGFDLRAGTTMEEAVEVARFLKKHIKSIFITRHDDDRGGSLDAG